MEKSISHIRTFVILGCSIAQHNSDDEKGRRIARYTNGELEMRIKYDEDEEGNGFEARFFNPNGTLFCADEKGD